MEENLAKAITQKHLTQDTVDAQFCSDWLKREMHRLFDTLAAVRGAVEAGECRGDEDCDHCYIVHKLIDPTLEGRD